MLGCMGWGWDQVPIPAPSRSSKRGSPLPWCCSGPRCRGGTSSCPEQWTSSWSGAVLLHAPEKISDIAHTVGRSSEFISPLASALYNPPTWTWTVPGRGVSMPLPDNTIQITQCSDLACSLYMYTIQSTQFTSLPPTTGRPSNSPAFRWCHPNFVKITRSPG